MYNFLFSAFCQTLMSRNLNKSSTYYLWFIFLVPVSFSSFTQNSNFMNRKQLMDNPAYCILHKVLVQNSRNSIIFLSTDIAKLYFINVQNSIVKQFFRYSGLTNFKIATFSCKNGYTCFCFLLYGPRRHHSSHHW